jgi:serine/threonine-protein kinase
VENLRVVARSTAFSFKETDLDVREIGRQLDVGTALEGSVRRSGETLRITAQLVDVAGGDHHWSERFDREMRDVFVVQDEIAQAIVEATNVKLVSPGSAPIVRKPTQDVEAYSLYLEGRFHWSKRTDGDLRRAIDCFEQAISRDPGFALALAGLADSYNVLGYYSFIPPEQAFPLAVSNSVRALELDDGLAEAHTSLAFATMLHDWDWTSAERAFLRALGLCPRYPTAQHWYSEYLAFQGRMDEALVMAEAALENDPLSLIINTVVGWMHYYARDYDRAAAKLQEVLEMEAAFIPAHLWLGLAHCRLARPDEAVTVLRRGAKLARGNPVFLSALGCAHAAAGRMGEAEEQLSRLVELARRSHVPGYHVAAIHAALGRSADAFQELEQAFRGRDLWLVFLGVDPIWDGMRGEKRFEVLLRRMGLPAPGGPVTSESG